MNERSSSGSRWYQLVVKDLLELQYITSMAIAHGGDPTSHLEAIGPTVRSLQVEIEALEAELARRDKSDR